MARRIVSLVPSLSETLAVWGLQPEIVGCTQFCVTPSDLHRTATVIGGTKDFSVPSIRALQPSHILVNQEENPKAAVQALSESLPVLVTFPRGPLDVPPMLRAMGEFLNVQKTAESWAQAIEAAIAQLPTRSKARLSFLYFIWREPYMLAGPDTYISRLLELAGWRNAYQGDERYPALSLAELQSLGADALLLSSEPYPFRRRDAARLRAEWPKAPPLYKVDGQLLSWYGTRTLEALEELTKQGKGESWGAGLATLWEAP